MTNMSAYTKDGHVTHIQRANNKCRNQAGWKAKLLSVGFATRTKLVSNSTYFTRMPKRPITLKHSGSQPT